ncbi:nucleoside-diphosphate-sugar epimerase [Kitasatospora sp. GAS204A]|uniref:SDR family oxidoreductase n=1 Tax=unclassified Kitasatospora TaxID=2633591 RepID=UPI002472F8A0|nr:SDR family oxidoreductase [Kitasatospora sp. GAS204B]MDH6122330.1 nucleoside-diphosphate-sugar epimerase [Kitasatospora sp. GAS204B]
MTAASRPTVVLTGATGVIGTSLLTSLTAHYEVTALVHRRRPEGATTCLKADLTSHRLGLTASQYREFAAGIDAVVHCAGLTDFAPPDLASFDQVNAEGTRRILELAEAAHVPVILLSSAAAAFDIPGEDLVARSLRAYSHSKRRAEELATRTSQPVAVVRAALLFAARDAVTAPRQQFPHALLTALLQDRPGGLPVHPEHWADILPMESLVDYLTALTAAMLRGDRAAPGLHWTTAGPARLTAADLERACLDHLQEAGRPPKGRLLADPATARGRSHGMARIAQLGLLPPEEPALPTDLLRYLPAQPSRADVLDALAHTVRRCAPWAPCPERRGPSG